MSMFIHPASDQSNTTVSNLDQECIQPNAVDLRIDKVYALSDNLDDRTAEIATDGTTHAVFEEVVPNILMYELQPGLYQFTTEHDVDIAPGELGWLKGRSSLVRNGMIVYSGLYDSGFNGTIGGVLQVVDRPVNIEKGARVCQLVLAPAQALHSYDGQYQNTSVITE